MNEKQYVKEVIRRSCLPMADRKRLKSDLESEINSGVERGEPIGQIIERMGDPDKVGAELYENFGDIIIRPFREYKSKRTLFGLPLTHIIRPNYTPSISHFRTVSAKGINAGERYRHFGLPTAHGIFAVGAKAKGFIAVGNLSVGFISIGNPSAGLFSIRNFALALLISFGNMAVGMLSAGNIALGYGAAENIASSKFTIGNEAAGTFTFSISNLSEQLVQVKAFFAGLNVPAPVKAFLGIVEKALEVLNDPITAMPLIITLLKMKIHFPHIIHHPHTQSIWHNKKAL